MGSEAAAGGHGIEWPGLSVPLVLDCYLPHPFLEVLWIEIDFGGFLECFFLGRMVSTDKLAYSLLFYKRR